jgi:hypothetical protein
MARRRKNGRSLFGLDGVTKKDFMAIGTILCNRNASSGLVNDVADYFKSQNPRFDRDRFVTFAKKSCK